jgi:CheY-like chemotaxis protein
LKSAPVSHSLEWRVKSPAVPASISSHRSIGVNSTASSPPKLDPPAICLLTAPPTSMTAAGSGSAACAKALPGINSRNIDAQVCATEARTLNIISILTSQVFPRITSSCVKLSQSLVRPSAPGSTARDGKVYFQGERFVMTAATLGDILDFLNGFQLFRVVGGPPWMRLILLDMNLPKRSGDEVLKHLRTSTNCRHSKVLIVSSSDAPEDRRAVETSGVAGYFRKPSSYDEFMKLGPIIKSLLDQEA